MADSEEALQLKRRARRRLVGAIALVSFVVILLPLILDKEPGPSGPPLSVQIPRQDSGSFNTRVVPPPVVAPQPVLEKKSDAPADSAAAKASAPKADTTPADKVEQARVEAMLSDQTWVVALGSFSSADNLKQLQSKLSAAGVKSYTEPLKTAKGEQATRVRAGPFASKEAAEKAREQLAALGLKPGPVTNR
jgi:DedD protein